VLSVSDPVIDTQDIKISVENQPHFDKKCSVEVPAECITKIKARLAEGGMEQSDEQLVQLLIKISLDETVARFDFQPQWGPAFPAAGLPQLPPEGEDFCFDFVMDDAPDFSIPDFSEITIRKPVRVIAAADVQREVESHCIESGEHVPHVGPIAPGDRITFDLQIASNKDEVEAIVLKNSVARVVAGDAPLLINGIFFHGLSSVLVGHQVEEVVQARLSVPPNLQREAFDGDLHHFTINLTQVERSSPLSEDEVVKLFGTPSAAIFREQIRTALTQRFEIDQLSFMTEDLFRQLLEQVEYQPPQRVVQSRQKEFAQSQFQMVVNNGGSQEQAQSVAKDAFTSCEPLVERAMKRQAIALRLRALHSLNTSEDQIQEHIRQLAAVQNKRPEQLRQELVDAGQLNNISAKVLEKQITLLAMQHCTFHEIDADTLQ
jgi:FKBP-type peptidyl-prolyl cis-trans isomerase (trigger factor)